jgi:pantetheine-phosphate adenylyltransferase
LANKSNIAIYPGSFDPVTNGHIDLINRSSKLFNRLIVAVSNTSVNKKYLLNSKERMKLINKNINHLNNVEVTVFDNLLIDYANQCNANIIVRGLRAFSDFEYEFQMSLMNRKLDNNIDTVFLMPDEKYTYISSSIVKEVLSLGGNINDYVPASVLKALDKKYG